MARWDVAWQGKARQGMARRGKARLGEARRGTARLGEARRGTARLGEAWLGRGFITEIKMVNTILEGHVLEKLKEIPEEFVDCVVTSPPFWALRSYGTNPQIWDGESACQHEFSQVSNNKNPIIYPLKHKSGETNPGIEAWYKDQGGLETLLESAFCSICSAWKGELGLEPSVDLYIKHLCDVFDEVKRVLKKTGVCFVDLGDTYSGSGCGTNDYRTEDSCSIDGVGNRRNPEFKPGGLAQRIKTIPAKSLCLIPYRFAIEMVNRGWICRNVLIWHKSNCVPQSVKDRFTVDFEPVFFFTKSRCYYFKQQFEPHLIQENRPDGIVRQRTFGYDSKYLKKSIKPYFNQRVRDVAQGYIKSHQYRASTKEIANYKNRKLADTNYGGNGGGLHSHSGYYDYDGTPRFYPQGRNKRCVWKIPTKSYLGRHYAVFPQALVEPMIKAGCPERKEGFDSGIVLDPFFGSGTTAIVARKLDRNWIGIELKPEYCSLARKRIQQETPPTLFERENDLSRSATHV